MKKKLILFFLFVSVLGAMNLTSQVQCKNYSTANKSLTVRLSKADNKVKRDGTKYYSYEITIVSRVNDAISVVSFVLDNANRKKYKYVVENSPVDKVIEKMGSFKFTFLSTDGNIKASDFSITATICE